MEYNLNRWSFLTLQTIKFHNRCDYMTYLMVGSVQSGLFDTSSLTHCRRVHDFIIKVTVKFMIVVTGRGGALLDCVSPSLEGAVGDNTLLTVV